MKAGSRLLDTSAIVKVFRAAVAYPADESGVETCLSTIVLGELYFGAGQAAEAEKEFQRIGEFVLNCSLLAPDLETAKWYGKIKLGLKLKRPAHTGERHLDRGAGIATRSDACDRGCALQGNRRPEA